MDQATRDLGLMIDGELLSPRVGGCVLGVTGK